MTYKTEIKEKDWMRFPGFDNKNLKIVIHRIPGLDLSKDFQSLCLS